MLEFNLPKSTVYYLKNKYIQKDWSKRQAIDIYQDLFELKLAEIKTIDQIVEPPTTPLTIKWILDRWCSIDNTYIKQKNIANYLKRHLNYSFKKGSSTTYKGASNKVMLQQSIFAWRILSRVLSNKYIINIDESSF